MKFSVSEQLLQKHPDARIGVIVARNADNEGKNEEINLMLDDIQNKLVNFDFSNPVIAKWRSVYSGFGSKPSDYKCSAEALVRSAAKGRKIPSINKIVDLYNLISLKHVVPVGGEDLDKIKGGISLKFADGGENFTPLNSKVLEHPYRGEVIYCDDNGNVLCRRWNWRESDVTKLTEGTKNCIIFLEGFDEKVFEAAKEIETLIETLIQTFCSAETSNFAVDKKTPEIWW